MFEERARVVAGEGARRERERELGVGMLAGGELRGRGRWFLAERELVAGGRGSCEEPLRLALQVYL